MNESEWDILGNEGWEIDTCEVNLLVIDFKWKCTV